jgi:hypothetical protein
MHRAAEAWDLFRQYRFPQDQDRAKAASMDVKQFYALLHRWATPWFQGRNKQCQHTRAAKPGLTKKELKELSFLLATPAPRAETTVHYWRDIGDACEFHPDKERIRELVAKANVSDRVLKQRLLNCGGDLTFGVLDVRDKMPASTHKLREACAKVWRGEHPWLQVEGDGLAMPWSGTFPREPKGLRYVYWDYPWDALKYFTFQYDAFKLTEARGAKRAHLRGFHSKSRCFPPEEVHAGKSATDAQEVMWYVVTAPDGEVICGPEPCYHGSSPTLPPSVIKANRKADPAGPEIHVPEFPHWCASIPHGYSAHTADDLGTLSVVHAF